MPSAATISRTGRIMTKPMIAAAMVLLVACGSPARTQTAAATNRHPRSTARSDRALSGSTSRADVDERDKSVESHRARQVAEVQCEAERHTASGRRSESGVRREFRGLGPLSSSCDIHGGADRVDAGPGAGVRIRSKRGICQHSKTEETGADRRHAEEHAAAGGRDENDIGRRAGDRHRAHESADCVRAAIQHRGRLHTGPYHRDHPGGRRRRRRGDCGGSHWVHRRYRDWRSDEQPLLLRSIWMARRRLHVQRRVGRLLRRTGRCARGLDRITAKTLSRNAAIGWKTSGRTGRTAWRTRRSNAPTANRTGRKSGPTAETRQETDRQNQRTDTRPNEPSGRHRRKRPTQTPSASESRTAATEARGQTSGTRAQPSSQRTSSDAFSGYSSGSSQRASSARGQQSRSSSSSRRGGGGGSRSGGGVGADQHLGKGPNEHDESIGRGPQGHLAKSCCVVHVRVDGGSHVLEPCVRASRTAVRLT